LEVFSVGAAATAIQAVQDAHPARAHTVADGDALGDHPGLCSAGRAVVVQLVLHHAVVGLAAVDRFGPGLHDEEPAAEAVHRPLHVHGAPVALLVAVILLDGHHTARHFQGLLVGDAEAVALAAFGGDGERGLAGFHAVDHLAVLVTQLL